MYDFFMIENIGFKVIELQNNEKIELGNEFFINIIVLIITYYLYILLKCL